MKNYFRYVKLTNQPPLKTNLKKVDQHTECYFTAPNAAQIIIWFTLIRFYMPVYGEK